MLNSAPAKLYAKILYTVLATFPEKLGFLCANQNGRRRGRCCADNLLTVQNQKERQQSLGKPCTIICPKQSSFPAILWLNKFDPLLKLSVFSEAINLFNSRLKVIRSSHFSSRKNFVTWFFADILPRLVATLIDVNKDRAFLFTFTLF